MVAMIYVAVLVILFSLRRFETQRVGYSFSPTILIWYSFIAFIGIYNITKYDTTIFQDFYPKYIFEYFKRKSKRACTSLGGIVLYIAGK